MNLSANCLYSQGYTIKVGMIPYSEGYSADYNPKATDPRRLFRNPRGTEYEIVRAFCEVGQYSSVSCPLHNYYFGRPLSEAGLHHRDVQSLSPGVWPGEERVGHGTLWRRPQQQDRHDPHAEHLRRDSEGVVKATYYACIIITQLDGSVIKSGHTLLLLQVAKISYTIVINSPFCVAGQKPKQIRYFVAKNKVPPLSLTFLPFSSIYVDLPLSWCDPSSCLCGRAS